MKLAPVRVFSCKPFFSFGSLKSSSRLFRLAHRPVTNLLELNQVVGDFIQVQREKGKFDVTSPRFPIDVCCLRKFKS